MTFKLGNLSDEFYRVKTAYVTRFFSLKTYYGRV